MEGVTRLVAPARPFADGPYGYGQLAFESFSLYVAFGIKLYGQLLLEYAICHFESNSNISSLYNFATYIAR